jgi:hypothetical protein
MNMLTAHDFTKLAEELTLPVVVRDSLEHNCVSTENKMIMASLLTDMSAGQLLLSLACTLRLIADHKSDEPDIAKSLYYHADFMLDDYAPYWRHEGKTLFPAEWIVHIQEDLELLHEILNLTRDAFAYRDDTIYNLCEILIDYTAAKLESDSDHNVSEANISDLQIDIDYPSNVIAFPMDRINQSRA